MRVADESDDPASDCFGLRPARRRQNRGEGSLFVDCSAFPRCRFPEAHARASTSSHSASRARSTTRTPKRASATSSGCGYSRTTSRARPVPLRRWRAA